jgi:glycosyltransferase involved in cell wall biosynthesis
MRTQRGSGQLAWASRRVRGALAGLPRFDSRRWGFIYVSESLKRQYEAAGMRPARSRVVHNGVSLHTTPRWWPEEVPDVLTVGYVGRIWPNKGLEPLLEGFEQYLRTPGPDSDAGAVPPCQLRVWGRGDALYEGRLRARTEEEPLAGHVAWEGWRPREEMLSAYRGLDLLVVPSLWEEPFGLVTVEAMAAGVPVLASRRGALPEIVDNESGWLVEPTPDGLAGGLSRALGSYRVLAEKGRAARERVRRQFRWDDKVGGVEAFLEESLRAVG